MSKKGGTDNSGQQAAQDEAARQARITQGTDAVNKTFDGQFTPDYYARIAKGYTDFANPQLDSQYKTTQKNLAYSLARDGNLDSSTSGDQAADLLRQYQGNKLQIVNQGQTYANTTKSNVETARTGLINSLDATGDASAAANNAANQAAALAATPSYSALGSLFSTTTGALAAQAANERAAAISNGTYRTPYNTGLFGGLGSAVKVS